MTILKVGDKVFWSARHGQDPFVEATVTRIEMPLHEEQKAGVTVEQIAWNDIRNCVVELHSGKWAYGYQLRPLEEKLEELDFYEQD